MKLVDLHKNPEMKVIPRYCLFLLLQQACSCQMIENNKPKNQIDAFDLNLIQYCNNILPDLCLDLPNPINDYYYCHVLPVLTSQ
jgi:hypothetical protein